MLLLPPDSIILKGYTIWYILVIKQVFSIQYCNSYEVIQVNILDTVQVFATSYKYGSVSEE